MSHVSDADMARLASNTKDIAHYLKELVHVQRAFNENFAQFVCAWDTWIDSDDDRALRFDDLGDLGIVKVTGTSEDDSEVHLGYYNLLARKWLSDFTPEEIGRIFYQSPDEAGIVDALGVDHDGKMSHLGYYDANNKKWLIDIPESTT